MTLPQLRAHYHHLHTLETLAYRTWDADKRNPRAEAAYVTAHMASMRVFEQIHAMEQQEQQRVAA